MEDKTLKIIGYITLLFWVISSLSLISIQAYFAVLWFCNIALLILAIGCFQKSITTIYTVLSISLLFQIPWTIDWIIYVLLNTSLFNIPNLYLGTPIYVVVLSAIRHIISVPLEIALLTQFKPKKLSKKEVLIPILIGAISLIISFILPTSINLNCMKEPCGNLPFPFEGIQYTLFWTILTITASYLSYKIIVFPMHKLIWKVKGFAYK